MKKSLLKKGLLIFALGTLPSALLYAEAPVTQLPGVVDSTPTPHPQPTPSPDFSPEDSKVFDLVQSLNQIPEDQLNEHSGAALPLLNELRKLDGPQFARLRNVLGRAEVRKGLNPSAKCVLATLLNPLWDAFNLTGNLWLASLQSASPDLRARGREKLVGYIQTAHVPVLINVMKIPGPNVLAYEIVQEVTGQKLEPDPKVWAGWWAKGGSKTDLVANTLNQSRFQMLQIKVRPFDQNAFWYLPAKLDRADVAYDRRSASERKVVDSWVETANFDAKRYLDECERIKPMLDRVKHQPDGRVAEFLQSLVGDPGLGDYASILLAWRGHTESLKAIQDAYVATPTVGRALARGSMGDKTALEDLLKLIEPHKTPLAYGIMDDNFRVMALKLTTYGSVSAEQAFELLTRERFGLSTAMTASEKKKAIKKAQTWMQAHYTSLSHDKKRGYHITEQPKTEKPK